MKTLEKISQCMKDRPAELRELKSQGKKIVGYFPGGYFPEEMVYACDAVPVALNRGGDHEPVEVAGSYMSRWIWTFGRANIGYKVLGNEPVYEAIDIFIVPIGDNHIRILADTWDAFTDVEVFRYGIPHVKHDVACQYFLTGLNFLKEKLQDLTGNEITDQKLKEAIELCNRERVLLRQISEMRKSEIVPIASRDFAMLNHASLVLDKKVMVNLLEELLIELQTANDLSNGPRLMLMGTTLAHGDYRILDMIGAAGATVVIEEFSEGMRHYWEPVTANGDLIQALADRYFMKRIPPAWFRPGTERQEAVVELAKGFNVDGVIWYQMMNRETDEFESYWYPDVFQKGVGVSMLKLVSDYDSVERGPFSTRIETFVETIRR